MNYRLFTKISLFRIVMLLLMVISFCALVISTCSLAKILFQEKEDKSSIQSSFKKESVLMPQVHLSNEYDCADVVLTTVCQNNKCENFVNAFFTACADSIKDQD